MELPRDGHKLEANLDVNALEDTGLTLGKIRMELFRLLGAFADLPTKSVSLFGLKKVAQLEYIGQKY